MLQVLYMINNEFSFNYRKHPPGSRKASDLSYFGFAYCMLRSRNQIPQRNLTQDCASQYGIDIETLDASVNRKIDESN
ncbi:hypothetical protein PABG_00935 [Paracoccidioides brasiliensis Pb03]|nr:hypothetical protein PABG_00935 [Paracoccidioides brasiliensis Pb03]